jgi:hypothetical protein
MPPENQCIDNKMSQAAQTYIQGKILKLLLAAVRRWG